MLLLRDLGRGQFSSLGLITYRGSDLKPQQWSWRWYNSSLAITLTGEFSNCGQATSPGCHCFGGQQQPGTASYWPGKLLFRYSVINQIQLLTLARESSYLLLQLTGAISNKKWKLVSILHEKVKNHNFFILKSEIFNFFVLKSDKYSLICKVK